MLLRLLFVVLLFCCVVLFGERAEARPGGGWHRPVGSRLAKHPTRRERKCFAFRSATTYFTDVQHDPARIVRRIEAFKGQGRARVTLVDDGKGSVTHWRTGKAYKVYKIELPAQGKPRRGRQPLKVCLSAGVHGDEGVGPEAMLRLVERGLKDKSFAGRFDLTVVIKVDPFGARRTPEGVDPNRCFGAGRWLRATRAMARAVGDPSQYGLFADLHSAGAGRETSGHFLIRGKNDGKLSRRILRAMNTQALWDAPAASPKIGPYSFHTLGGTATRTPGTFKAYMAQGGARQSYTLEAPRTQAPELQVKGMLKLLRSTMDNVAKYGR